MTRLVIAPAAALEITDTATAYEATQPGLARSFLTELDRALTGIGDYPFLAATIAPGFRRCVLHRLPFIIVYRMAADEVQILALFPTRADPGGLAARLQQRAAT